MVLRPYMLNKSFVLNIRQKTFVRYILAVCSLIYTSKINVYAWKNEYIQPGMDFLCGLRQLSQATVIQILPDTFSAKQWLSQVGRNFLSSAQITWTSSLGVYSPKGMFGLVCFGCPVLTSFDHDCVYCNDCYSCLCHSFYRNGSLF